MKIIGIIKDDPMTGVQYGEIEIDGKTIQSSQRIDTDAAYAATKRIQKVTKEVLYPNTQHK